MNKNPVSIHLNKECLYLKNVNDSLKNYLDITIYQPVTVCCKSFAGNYNSKAISHFCSILVFILASSSWRVPKVFQHFKDPAIPNMAS